ncbi:hypothetical protein F5X68DRAFT_272656 [Plectosphaerella plurivora]|uniref:Uncharacterized protein n=1 Tax=Plectosphaerella plurivora TaxID=936078 RepID=A0A9P9AEM2_9PEZI|nr:hypothetical protein F5X68DRAFT_272656 [Plectosphaerella plurivora]
MHLPTICALLASTRLVAGHAAIIAAVGDAGGSGMGLGVDTSTPRDGTDDDPFQRDATRFDGDLATSVGETEGFGNNNIESGTTAIMTELGDQLPQVSPGGYLNMTLHQVNADGGGPYTCMINSDGTAATWQPITVSVTPPGEDSRSRRTQASDQPMVAEIPANQACTGTVAGQPNVCMVRCQNDANAGPFGGVVPVQLAGAGNGTAAAARYLLARATLEKHLQMERMKLKREA